MTTGTLDLAGAADKILTAPYTGRRRLVALAGAPASGKSTVAESLAALLRQAGCRPQVVPMDGFHLDNRVLSARGLLDRKGAPDSFDAAGLAHLCHRLAREDEVFYPLFDRARDLSIAGAGYVAADCDTVIVEGNYLLFDTENWRGLAENWDVAIRLDVPTLELRRRLVNRWLNHGHTAQQALARAEDNDLKNAIMIERNRLDVPGQIVLWNSTE